jgi:hypothetical protein
LLLAEFDEALAPFLADAGFRATAMGMRILTVSEANRKDQPRRRGEVGR